MRQVALQELRDRGQSDEQIRELGGVIQADSLNVCFAAGESYDRASEVLKLPPLPKRPPPKSTDQWLSEHGPELWAQLHRWALAFDPSYMLAEPKAMGWLSSFANRLPCGKCRRHWREIVKAAPPTFDSADALFAWTVDRHNEVNAKLGKAAVTLQRAREMYR